jgi:hypothetical protein
MFIEKEALDTAFNQFLYKQPIVVLKWPTITSIDLDADKDQIKAQLLKEYNNLKTLAYKDYESDMFEFSKSKCDDRLKKRLKLLETMLQHAYKTLWNEVPYGY